MPVPPLFFDDYQTKTRDMRATPIKNPKFEIHKKPPIQSMLRNSRNFSSITSAVSSTNVAVTSVKKEKPMNMPS